MREWQRNGLRMTDDLAAIHLPTVHRFMRESHWGQGRTEDTVRRAAENSIPLSVFDGEHQVAYARVLTDKVTSAWICDVFVDPQYRGRGIGKWIVETVTSMPELATCRMMLITRDAHGLYEQFGFERRECMWRVPDIAFG